MDSRNMCPKICWIDISWGGHKIATKKCPNHQWMEQTQWSSFREQAGTYFRTVSHFVSRSLVL